MLSSQDGSPSARAPRAQAKPFSRAHNKVRALRIRAVQAILSYSPEQLQRLIHSSSAAPAKDVVDFLGQPKSTVYRALQVADLPDQAAPPEQLDDDDVADLRQRYAHDPDAIAWINRQAG